MNRIAYRDSYSYTTNIYKQFSGTGCHVQPNVVSKKLLDRLDLHKFASRLGLQDIVNFEKEGIPSKPWVT